MDQHHLPIPVAPEPYEEVRRTVDSICKAHPGKYWRELEDAPLAAHYPESFVTELEHAGFLAAGVPEAYGGIGLPIDALARIVETVHASGCNGDAISEQMALTELLIRHGSEEIRADILPRVAEGAIRLQSLAIWERNSGRTPTRIQATADKVAGGFVISGTKRWVRFADRSDTMLVVARTGEAPASLSIFLVDSRADRSRVTVSPIAAMNNFGGHEVRFDGLVVPEDRIVGELDQGLNCLVYLKTVSGIFAASAAAGYSRFFCRKGVDYANERVVFGNPIGKYQGIQFPLAQSYMESQGAPLLLQLATTLFKAGRPCHAEAMMAQYMAVQAAWESAEAAFTTHGGFAFAREYDIERAWREVRFMRNEAAASLAGGR
jgi:acyl-CoA dehydrogenase